MTVTNDDRFPPIRKDTDDGPLDLSVLAKVSTAEEPRPFKQEKPKDTPPRARARAPRGSSKTENKQTEDKPAATPRTFVRDDDETPKYSPGLLVKPLRDLYVTVGTLVLPFNQAVGTAFIQNAEACARSLDNAAKTDKQIRRVLMLLITGSVWGEVIVAHMPIMMALAVTMVPAVRQSLNVESPQSESETINPVSNGYAPGR